MTSFNPAPSDSDSEDIEIDDLLKKYESLIRRLANTYLTCNYQNFDVEDLIQRSLIKLWRAAEKTVIVYPKSYIARIVSSEFNSMLREQKKHLQLVQLSVDHDGEPVQGHVMISCGEAMQDPLEEIIDKEVIEELIRIFVALVATLPPRQKQAMICKLKDCVDDLEILGKVFEEYGIHIEYENWPKDKKDRQRLAASLSAALKKLTSI